MDAATREEICCAAIRAAKAVDYVGAGTIEFIADASEGLRADRIFFMEMNTRLQVEHPVTEEITGVDLVEWQLRVASGEPIPLKQEEIEINGHAIEARLYAEDPTSGFLPSIGRLERLELFDYRGRTDTGVVEGSEVSPFYDPMIAKMIVHSSDRDGAVSALVENLESSVIWPVKTNKGFLVRLLSDDDVCRANLDTGLIARKFDELTSRPIPSDRVLSDAAAWLLRDATDFDDVATGIGAFRLNASPRRTMRLAVDGEVREFEFEPTPSGQHYEHGFAPIEEPGHQFVQIEGDVIALSLPRAAGTGAASAADGAILAPMPGKVIAVDVAEGDNVTAGQRLMVLEAMKMEHGLTAPFDGTVTEFSASEGGQVQVEAVLCVVEPEAAE